AHVDLERQERIAELVLQLAQPIAAATGAHRAPAARDELARRRFAETGGGAGDQDGFHRHSSTGPSSARRAAVSAVASTPICSETARRSGSCASRNRIKAESKSGSLTRSRSSSVPIPVRSRNRRARRSSVSVAARAARA